MLPLYTTQNVTLYELARPLREGDGKGADRGVDGLLYFYVSEDERRKIIVHVKGGGVKRGHAATLLANVNSQKAAGGILLTLEKPIQPMREEAADAGLYESRLWHDQDYPKVQILTIKGLLNNTERVGPEHKFDDVSEWHLDKA